MTTRAQVRLLPDGRRLYLNDGPIDIVLEAFGSSADIEAAYRAASLRFVTVLDELCSELTFLRQPASADGARPRGPVALRMLAAVTPFASETFITPMAAVAGAAVSATGIVGIIEKVLLVSFVWLERYARFSVRQAV